MPKKKKKTKPKKDKKEPRIDPNNNRGRKEAEKNDFIRFTALPRFLRKMEFGYENDIDFAKGNNVHPGTLVEWKKDKEFWEEVKDHWKRWGRDRTPSVIASLYNTAVKDGKASEVLAWMKIIEDMQDKSTVKVESEELKALTKEMRKLAES